MSARDNTIPFLVACVGIGTFAGMDSVMKGLAIEMGAYNAVLWRTGAAFLLSAAVFMTQRPSMPEPSVLKIHLKRGVLTSFMAYLFFWGLIYVPLAEAIALSFIAPLIALYLARLLLGEEVGPRAVFASVIGFTGALVILGGKLGGEYGEQVWLGMAAVLLSAVMYAYNLILQRQQALVAKPLEIAVFQNGIVSALYLLLAPFLLIVPDSSLTPSIVGAAMLGLCSVLALSWAYARAEARVLISVEYTAFIWAGILGWIVFGETITLITLAGTALIVAGCLMAARQH